MNYILEERIIGWILFISFIVFSAHLFFKFCFPARRKNKILFVLMIISWSVMNVLFCYLAYSWYLALYN